MIETLGCVNVSSWMVLDVSTKCVRVPCPRAESRCRSWDPSPNLASGQNRLAHHTCHQIGWLTTLAKSAGSPGWHQTSCRRHAHTVGSCYGRDHSHTLRTPTHTHSHTHAHQEREVIETSDLASRVIVDGLGCQHQVCRVALPQSQLGPVAKCTSIGEFLQVAYRSANFYK